MTVSARTVAPYAFYPGDKLQETVSGLSSEYVGLSGIDDSAAMVSATPEILLRAGAYKAPTGVALSAQATLHGRGMGAITINGVTAGNDWQDGLTHIDVSTDAVDGVALTSKGCMCDKFGVRFTGGTATSGAGIHATAASGLRLRDVSVKDFFNGIQIASMNNYLLDGVLVCDPVNYGIYITGNDQGDGMMRNLFLLSGPTRNGVSALRWEGGGGVQVSGVKTNCVNNKPWTNGLDLIPNFATGEISVSDSVIDSYTGIGVNLDGTTSTPNMISFSDVKVRGSLNPTNGYKINHANVVLIQGGAVEMGTNGLTAFDIANVNHLTISDVAVRGVPSANPIVSLASTVSSAKISLGNLAPPGATGAVTWPAGSIYLLNIGQQQGFQEGGHGEFTFSWLGPAFSSKVTYSSLWQVFMNGGCVIEFTFMSGATGVTPYILSRQTRMAVNNGGALAVTTLGTDTATSTDIDIQWRVSGKSLFIEAKLNSGSLGTNVGAPFSTVRITGIPNQVYAYS